MIKENIISDLSCDLFEIPKEFQGPQIAEYFISELNRRGYESVGSRGWGQIHFIHGHFIYGIWPDGTEKIIYGILSPKNHRIYRKNGRMCLEPHDHVGGINYLDDFLRDVDSRKWDYLLEKVLKKLDEKPWTRVYMD